MLAHRLRSIALRLVVRRRWEQAAAYYRVGEGQRLFPVVGPDVVWLLLEGRVEETLEQLARARWCCAEIRSG